MLVSPGASVNYVPLSLSLSLSFPLLLSISLFLSLANRAWDRARPPGILVHIAAVHISGVLARLAAGNEQGQLQALDRSPITRYHDRSRRSERKHTRDQGQSLLGTYRSTRPTTTGQTPRCSLGDRATPVGATPPRTCGARAAGNGTTPPALCDIGGWCLALGVSFVLAGVFVFIWLCHHKKGWLLITHRFSFYLVR